MVNPPGQILAPPSPFAPEPADARTGIGGLPMRRDVLDAASAAFRAGESFRARRTRSRNYYRGHQLEDRVLDPETGFYVTERDAIANQNRTPISNNEIGVMVRNLKGVLALNKSQPTPFPADRDDAAAAQMMSAALKGVFNVNRMARLEAAQLEEAILSGREVYAVRYGPHPATGRADVTIDRVNPARFFFNADAEDPRGFDVRLVGELQDLPFDEVVMAFAVDPLTGAYDAAKASALAQSYGANARQAYAGSEHAGGFTRTDGLSFLVPADRDGCRLIWTWRKERGPVVYIEDPETGQTGDDAVLFTAYGDGEDPFTAATFAAEQEWATRMETYLAARAQFDAAVAQGMAYTVDGSGALVPLTPPLPPGEPTVVQRFESVWTGYALTPGAEVMWTGRAPWLHGEHPYCFQDTTRVDGETWGLIEDVIDPQRMYNRVNSVIDHIFGAGSKGAMVHDTTMLDANETTDDDVNRLVASASGSIGVKPGTGKTAKDFWGQAPPAAVPGWAVEWMDRYAERITRQGGVNTAMEIPAGDTSGFSYQLQQIAASTNTRDLFDMHFEVRRQVATKAMQIVAQFYDEPRQLRISPNRPPVLFDPAAVRDMEWDLVPGDVAETATAQLVAEKDLVAFWQGGGITFEEYLEVSGNPMAPELLNLIRSRAPAMLGMPAGAVAPDMLAAAEAGGMAGGAPIDPAMTAATPQTAVGIPAASAQPALA